ncbi:hypothetical protein BsWGS_02789 [Bradybaena similaris]
MGDGQKDDAPGPVVSTPISDPQNFDYMFKVLIIGNSGVGKTSFLFRYADNSFTDSFVSTVGIDFKVKSILRNNRKIKLQIWDTAGQERYRTITTAYYRGAMGFVLMYDVTNEASFNAVQDWIYQIKLHSCTSVPIVIVGNKLDHPGRQVQQQEGQLLATSLGIDFFETSAKENLNVNAVFDRLIDLICDKMAELVDVDPTLINEVAKSTRLSEKPHKGGCAC